MAGLTEQDRVEIWEAWMRQNKDPVGAITKLELRQAVDDLDDWFNANKASALASISEPAASELTGAQIAFLSYLIIEKRWIAGA